jgi:hypothetical protein
MQKTDYSGSVNICGGKAVELGYIVDCVERIGGHSAKLSPNEYKDSFEIESIAGSVKLISKYYKNYIYSSYDFLTDIKKTIDDVTLNSHN